MPNNLPKQNRTLPGDSPEIGSLRDPENSHVPVPWRSSPASPDKLYKEIYYSRMTKRVLGGSGTGAENAAAFQSDVKKRVKKRLIFRIAYNSLFLVMLGFIAVNLSRAWFTEVTAPEVRQTTMYVQNSSVPAYLSANFNNAALPGYTNDEIALAKTIIPGDVLNLSVFVDLTGVTRNDSVLVTVQDLPAWLEYMPESPVLTYADITSGSVIPMSLNKTSCATVVSPPVIATGTIMFQITLPDDYADYDGLCLDFGVYFQDTAVDQNQYMNQPVRLRFIASV